MRRTAALAVLAAAHCLQPVSSEDRAEPDSRCFHVPDWKRQCDLPMFDYHKCLTTWHTDHEPHVSSKTLYLTGWYFSQHDGSCHPAKYINPGCAVAQDRPVFNTREACENVCYLAATQSCTVTGTAGCCCDGTNACTCLRAAHRCVGDNPKCAAVELSGVAADDAATCQAVLDCTHYNGCHSMGCQLGPHLNLAQRTVANPYAVLDSGGHPVGSQIGHDCASEGLRPSMCHEASIIEGMDEELGIEQAEASCTSTICISALFVVNLFGLLMCFLALAIICDDFLVPPIEHFCKRYRIPAEAAGASFLAFGSSAPEIVIATIATLSGGQSHETSEEEGGGETGLSTVLGSAVLAFGLIPAVSAILAPPMDTWDVATTPPELYKGGLLLELKPLVRDVSFAILGFSLIFAFGSDGEVVRWEALILVLGFFVYMAVIFVPIKVAEYMADKRTGVGASLGPMSSDDATAPPIPGSDHNEEATGLAKLFEVVVEKLSIPIEFLAENTIPHEPEEGEAKSTWLWKFEIGWENGWYGLGFTVSLVYVALLSDLILITAKYCCDAIGMSQDLEGVTVLAWGAQVPDMLASVAMAKKGLGPGAVANAVGSQIINVFIGLGLPYAIAGSSPLDTDGVMIYLLCLLVCMITFVGLCLLPMFKTIPWWLGGTAYNHGKLASSPILTPKSAWILCLVWALCNVAIVLMETADSQGDVCGAEERARNPYTLDTDES